MSNVTWQDEAACRDKPSSLFFPESVGTSKPTIPELYAAAKAVCATCPVTAECLAYAVANGERFGVWGNTTPSERRGMADHRCAVCGAPIVRRSGGVRTNCEAPACQEAARERCLAVKRAWRRAAG